MDKKEAKPETVTTTLWGLEVVMTDKYSVETVYLPEMERVERGFLPAIFMWILAIMAMVRTVVEVVVSFPIWFVANRGVLSKCCANAVRHWYEGPYIFSSLFFDAFSRTLHEIRKGATGAGALHFIYNWVEREEWDDVDLDRGRRLGRWVADWWIHMNNARAVRNRRVLVRYLTRRRIEQWATEHRGQTMRILSVACGSAQPLLEALLSAEPVLVAYGVKVELRLLDKSNLILTHAMRLVAKYGFDEWLNVATYCCSYRNIRQVCDDGTWDPHHVEGVGIDDYLDGQKARWLVSAIYELLTPGGTYLSGHTMSNREAFPLRWLIAWAMLYRSPRQLGDIVSAAFRHDQINLYLEPGHIHVVAEARKG